LIMNVAELFDNGKLVNEEKVNTKCHRWAIYQQ
jgi:hypothetical protein